MREDEPELSERIYRESADVMAGVREEVEMYAERATSNCKGTNYIFTFLRGER